MSETLSGMGVKDDAPWYGKDRVQAVWEKGGSTVLTGSRYCAVVDDEGKLSVGPRRAGGITRLDVEANTVLDMDWGVNLPSHMHRVAGHETEGDFGINDETAMKVAMSVSLVLDTEMMTRTVFSHWVNNDTGEMVACRHEGPVTDASVASMCSSMDSILRVGGSTGRTYKDVRADLYAMVGAPLSFAGEFNALMPMRFPLLQEWRGPAYDRLRARVACINMARALSGDQL
jgi:hypothetical protein